RAAASAGVLRARPAAVSLSVVPRRLRAAQRLGAGRAGRHVDIGDVAGAGAVLLAARRRSPDELAGGPPPSTPAPPGTTRRRADLSRLLPPTVTGWASPPRRTGKAGLSGSPCRITRRGDELSQARRATR